MTLDRTALSFAVLAGIVAAAGAIVFGPMFSPPGFDWIVHSTSEQAGQGMPGASIMRTGFVGYGLGVAVASTLRWRDAPAVRTALFAFGLGLIATAIWSNAPILPGLPADMAEDNLHSIASGVVGTAFAIACAARLIGRRHGRPDWLALSGVIIAVAIPLAMNAFPDLRGLLQRAMFAFSFVFVLREFGITLAWRSQGRA
jgi:hypothetical protein